MDKARQKGELALQMFMSLRHIKTPEVHTWLGSISEQARMLIPEMTDQKKEQERATMPSTLVTSHVIDLCTELLEPPSSAPA